METTMARLKAIRPVVPLMVASFQYSIAFMLTLPFMVDVVLGAICPGQTECSQLMILTGAQQLATGLGAVVMGPALGGLSDDYGRKPVLMGVFFSSIVPSVILASSKTKLAVYAWFLLGIFVSILRDGGFASTLLAYIADVVDEGQRASVVGLAMAASSVGFLVGTSAALAIPTATQAYWAAALFQVSASTCLVLFVKETNARQPLLPAEQSQSESKAELLPKPVLQTQSSKLRDTAKTIWRSRRLRTIALVDFTYALVGVTSGLQAFTMYYLKSTLNFGKNQFAVLSIISSVGITFGQMVVYPGLSYLCGERGVLWIGLLGSSAHYFIYSFTWAPWVPYLAGGMGIFYSLIAPSVGTMASRGVDHEHQGKVQGFMSGVRSAAVIVAPLVLTPITAASFGDNPPFNIRTLPLLMGGSVMVVGWLIALGLPRGPPSEVKFASSDYIEAPVPVEDQDHTHADNTP